MDSPQKAVPLVGDLPTLDELYRWVRDPRPRGTPPLGSDLAMVTSQLRSRLSAGVHLTDPEPSSVRRNKRREPWPELPPPAAFAAGVPLNVVLHQAIRSALHRSLGSGFRQPVRRLLAAAHGPQAVCWYGQQDAAWIGYYDILRRLGLARYGPDDAEHLNHWIAVARSCGWWWPGEHVCVVVERPESVHVEPVPRALHDEVRLRRDGVRYRDGWCPAVG